MSTHEQVHLDFCRLQFVRERSDEFLIPTSVKHAGHAEEIIRIVVGLQNETQEVFGVICLNLLQSVVGVHTLFRGSMQHSIAEPREAFVYALLNGASFLILFHNHPNGKMDISSQDIEATKRFVACGELLNIQVVDHMIVSSDGLTNQTVSIRSHYPELFN